MEARRSGAREAALAVLTQVAWELMLDTASWDVASPEENERRELAWAMISPERTRDEPVVDVKGNQAGHGGVSAAETMRFQLRLERVRACLRAPLPG